VGVGHIQPQHHRSVIVARRVPEHVGTQLDAQIDHEAGSFHYGENQGADSGELRSETKMKGDGGPSLLA